MADPEIKITFKSDSSNVEKDLDRIEQKLEKMPKRIPLGQGRWNPNVPSGPNGPKNPLKEEYEAGYSAMQEELAALAEQYAQLEVQTEKLTNAYREELSALDENAQGYAENKKELEALIAKGETLEKTLAAQSASVEKQSISLQNLNDNVGKIGYQKAIQEQNKMGLSLGVMTKTFEQTEQQISNYAEAWNNKLAKAQEKATKDEQKYQATLKVTGKTYEELTQLYSQLIAARARAQTPEQIQAIDRQLTAVRKNITLMGREAQLSGAKMIGSQTSVLGVMQEVNRQWRNGVLTLKGLTQGIKLFAKSTVVLAAIQLAWEGISWALEKAKTAIFRTAEEEEKAVKRAEDLAAAYDDAVEAVARLAKREVDSQKLNELKNLYVDLNTELRTRNKLMDDSLRKLSAELAMRAKDEDFQKTLKKNEIMREFWSGAIDEEERDRRLDELNVTSAEQKRQRTMEQRQAELEAAQAKEQNELDRYGMASGKASKLQMEKNQRFYLSPEQAELEYANLLQAENQVKQRQKEINELKNLIKAAKKVAQNGSTEMKIAADVAIKEYQKQIENIDLEAAEEVVNKGKRNLQGIATEDIESGRYKEKYESINEQLKIAKEEADKAKANYEAAQAATLAKQSELDLSDAQTKQDVNIAKETVKENAKQRDAQRTYKKNQEEKQRYDRFLDEARQQAERDINEAKQREERLKKLQKNARFEGELDGRMSSDAKKLADGGALDMLSDGKLSSKEIKNMIEVMKQKANKENEALHTLLQEVINVAIANEMVTAKTLKKHSKQLQAYKLKLSDPSR